MQLQIAALAATLASAPLTALAQQGARATVAAHEVPRASLVSSGSDVLPTAVSLTRTGTFASPAETLGPGLELVDEQRVDVDGDGDADALLMVDAAEGSEPKLDSGRGVAIAFHDASGWRGVTVASVGYAPLEAAFNWGVVEALHTGAPLLHVRYSEAVPGRTARQSDTVVIVDHGAIRPVFRSALDAAPDAMERGIERTLVLEATDLDGDGTSELLERVTEQRVNHTQSAPITIARRVYHWAASERRFVQN